MIRGWLHRFATTAAFRPALIIYISAVLIAAAVAAQWVRGDVGVVVLGIVAVLAVLAAMHREVEKVHTLVNSQRDEMVAHIDDLTARVEQLTAVLIAAGQHVPVDPAQEGP